MVWNKEIIICNYLVKNVPNKKIEIKNLKLTPQFLHELLDINAEFGGIDFGKLFKGKSPSVETGSKTDGGIGGVNTDDTHRTIIVGIGGNDDVDVLNNTLESQKQIFLLQLQFQEGTVHFVHEKNGLDPFGDSLTQYSFGLHAHT